ncbi:50S ribosomal protein L21 [Candidatus Calescamantes bacterium]|nr:50S ribosomal protein L21 [bacterium]MCK5224244.1 50S ribosomal protein L21 [Candidatus Calescamantes bacterium]
MFVVIATGGKQYKVKKGDTINVEYLKIKAGDAIKFDVKFAMDDKMKIVDPSKIIVDGEVIKNFKDKKVIAFKFKRRKNYHLTKGHRQLLSQVMIKDIKVG